MNMACKACWFLGGLGACPPGNFLKLDAARLNLVAILANNCILLNAIHPAIAENTENLLIKMLSHILRSPMGTKVAHFSGKYALFSCNIACLQKS